MHDDKLKNEADEKVIDFLKDAVAYLENRIAIVDNKASILIAVQGIFFALLTYVIKEVFLTTYQSCINIFSYGVLGVSFVIFIATELLLLQTIRPSKKFFGLNVPVKDKDKIEKEESHVLWPSKKFPTTLDNYINKIDTFDLSKIKKNYEIGHFITLQLVRNKYMFYRWAVVGMKILVLWSAIGITIIAFLTFLK